MPSPHSRRDALLLLGGSALSLLAGCTTRSGGAPRSAETTDGATTDSPTETSTETDVSVERVRVAPEVVAPNSPDSIDTVGERDEQFVLVEVTNEETPLPDRDESTLATADDSYESAIGDTPIRENGLWDYGEYRTVPKDLLVFSVPKPLDAESVELRWPGGAESVGEDAIRELNRPPTEFSVELSSPDSVTGGEDATVTVTAENVGGVPGTFVGALNRRGPEIAYMPLESVSLELDAGETTEWTHTFESKAYYGVEDPKATFSLAWRDGRSSTTIAVEADSS